MELLLHFLCLCQKVIFELPFASGPKRVFVRYHSYENVFHLHVHFQGNHSFSYERFCARTRFKIEVQGNSGSFCGYTFFPSHSYRAFVGHTYEGRTGSESGRELVTSYELRRRSSLLSRVFVSLFKVARFTSKYWGF